MFERLVLYFSNREDYLDIGIISFFFTVISVFLVHRLVPFNVGGTQMAGLMVVLLTSLACAYPFVRHLLLQEQKEVENTWSESRLLRRHAEDMSLYLAFFVGTTLGFAASTFFVPGSFYSIQMQVLDSIGAPTGNFWNATFFWEIVTNNLWVFAVTFILTFFIASGVVFVLAWNASVLGVLIGDLSTSLLEVPILTIPYLPHGLLEIAGYVLAGIAGALLSYEAELVMFEEHDVDIDKTLVIDVATLLVLGVGCILVAGMIEVL
jgi:uncharacterized membrane protein SpoIIM required for sporulation